MKYCIKCGTQLTDHAQFCISCGTRCNGYSAPVSVNPIQQQTVPQGSTTTERAGLYFKKVATSPMVICLAIIQTFLVMLSLYTAFFPSAVLDLSALNEMTDTNIGGILLVTGLISSIPTVLVAIGIWITVFSASRNKYLRNAKGVRLIHGLYKVLRILLPIACCVLTIILFSACSRLTYSGSGEVYGEYSVGGFHIYTGSNLFYNASVASAVLVYIVLLWGIGGFLMWFYSKIISTLDSLAVSIAHGILFAEISMVVIVMCFVSGGLSAISLLISTNWVDFVSSGLSAASQIMTGVLLLNMRNQLQ